MQITCSKCSTSTTITVNFNLVNYSCPQCSNLFLYKTNGEIKFEKKYKNKPAATTLYIGQNGLLDGIEYCVTGMLIKQVDGPYFWKEYILTPNKGAQKFLSETDGHWILLHEIEDAFDVRRHPRTIAYNGITLQLYEYDNTTIAYAAGFFDYDLPEGYQSMDEYINPPYIISIEKENGNSATFYGEHIAASKVKKIFNVPVMPPKTGKGIVQPFYIDLQQTAIIALCFAIVILVSHYFIYSTRSQKEVFKDTLSFLEYNNKDFVSKSFTLTGGLAPLAINVSSNVDNSWAAIQVGLVNEVTNEEVYANKDIEYYHGYEGGENWSEGSMSQKFNICGVSAGKYHLVLTPQKSADDANNHSISVTARWDEPSIRNALWPIGIMIVLLVAIYYWRTYFERQRWENSSYTSYN